MPQLFVLLATVFPFALNSVYLTAHPVLAAVMQDDLDLSVRQLGLLAGIYTIAYGVAQLPSGLLASRISSYRVLLLGSALMTISTFLWAFSPTFTAIFIARAIGGLGGGTVLPSSVALLSEAFKGKDLVRAMGLFASSHGLGILVGMFFYSTLLSSMPWRQIVLLSAIAGAAVFTFVLYVTTVAPAGVRQDSPAYLVTLKNAVVNWNINLLGIMNFAGIVAHVGVLAWLPLYLTRRFGSSPAEASAILAGVGLLLFLGAPTGSLIGNRINVRTALVLPYAVITIMLLLLGAPFAASKLWVLVFAMLLTFANFWYVGPAQSLISRFVPEGAVAVAAGYYNTMGWLGTFLSTFLFAIVVESSGSFTLAFCMLAIFPIIGMVAAFKVLVHPLEELN